MASKLLRLACAALAALGPASAFAHGNGHDDDDDRSDDRAKARLSSYQEVPAISSAANASFSAKVSSGQISWVLNYRGLESDATQAHIHFGQKSVNGGIVVFLCSNLGNGPAGTQACPLRAGTVRGTLTAADVVGPGGQGIAAGQFDEFVRAIRSGITYANVHTVTFPGGEVRGQIQADD